MKRERKAAGASPPAARAQQGGGEPCPQPAARRAAEAAPRTRVVPRKPPPFVPGNAGPVGEIEPLARAIATVLKQARLDRGLTLAELAGRAHVDPGGWRRFEKCERRSSVDMMARGLRVLRMDFGTLLRAVQAELEREARAGSQADNRPLDETRGARCNRPHASEFSPAILPQLPGHGGLRRGARRMVPGRDSPVLP